MTTIKGLHLQYRLWIADMNADIDVLRILNDYIIDNLAKDHTEETVKRITNFKELFLKLRHEMDDLRHEMHLNKMKLGTLLHNEKQRTLSVKKSINHTAFKQRYNLFRKSFVKTKKEFQAFENA
jgi:hypothetical protein